MRPLPARLDEGIEKSSVLGAPSSNQKLALFTSVFGLNDRPARKTRYTIPVTIANLTVYDTMGQFRSAKGPGTARF